MTKWSVDLTQVPDIEEPEGPGWVDDMLKKASSSAACRTTSDHFVTRCLVGATVLAGGASEIENVNQVFQPDGRFAASNSP